LPIVLGIIFCLAVFRFSFYKEAFFSLISIPVAMAGLIWLASAFIYHQLLPAVGFYCAFFGITVETSTEVIYLNMQQLTLL